MILNAVRSYITHTWNGYVHDMHGKHLEENRTEQQNSPEQPWGIMQYNEKHQPIKLQNNAQVIHNKNASILKYGIWVRSRRCGCLVPGFAIIW